MRVMLLAVVSIGILSFAGCGGNVIGTEFPRGVRPEGARPVPQSYYLPMGEVPITLEWDESKQRFDYVSEYAAVNVPDRQFGRFNLWHRHAGLSREQMSVTVDPKTMLLQKASSTYEPRTNEALIATANLIRQTTELRAALSPQATLRTLREEDKEPSPKCNGVKVAARIPIAQQAVTAVPLTNIVAIDGCEFRLYADVRVLDGDEAARPGVNVPAMLNRREVDKDGVEAACAESICFRLPVRYQVTLTVKVRKDRNDFAPVPQIAPFEVSAPDRTRVAFMKFPTGVFAAKATGLEFSDGVLATYTVDNESPVVGTLTVATSALLVATAVAEMH